MMLSSFIYSLLCLLLSKAAKSIDQFQVKNLWVGLLLFRTAHLTVQSYFTFTYIYYTFYNNPNITELHYTPILQWDKVGFWNNRLPSFGFSGDYCSKIIAFVKISSFCPNFWSLKGWFLESPVDIRFY